MRVVADDGSMLGIMSAEEALKQAEQRNLDLVKVSPEAKPPVCKILDYGKFKYEQNRKEKENKKNQKVVNIKEIRTSVRVQDHDLEVKAKNCRKFLSAGDKVKVSVRFRGREMAYVNRGREVLLKFASMVDEVGTIETKPKLEGRNYTMTLSPIKGKEKK